MEIQEHVAEEKQEEASHDAQTACFTEGNTSNSQNTPKTFTQEELEKLLAERLKRERKNNAALAEIKGLVTSLAKRGCVHGGSYRAMAEELAALLTAAGAGKASEVYPAGGEPFTDAETADGIPTDVPNAALSEEKTKEQMCLNEARGNEKPLASGTETAEAPQGENQPGTPTAFGMLYALAEQFPNEDVAHDVLSDTFRMYARGREQAIDTLYAEYLAFKAAFAPQGATDGKSERDTAPRQSAADADGAAEMLSLSESVTFSREDAERLDACGVLAELAAEPERGYSAFGGGSAETDYGAALTARQMQLAKAEGMSYREYAELLEDAPGRAKARGMRR